MSGHSKMINRFLLARKPNFIEKTQTWENLKTADEMDILQSALAKVLT